MINEIPTENYIEAMKAAFSILGACLTVGFICMVNYEVTINIQENDDKRNRD